MQIESNKIKKILLQKIRDTYSKQEFLNSDPIEFVYRYTNPLDQECVALIAALFSYGNVSAIRNFLTQLFKRLGHSPYQTLIQNEDFSKILQSIGNYRFQKEIDIAEFLSALSQLIRMRDPLNDTLWEEYFLEDGILGFQKKIQSKLRFRSYGLDFLVGKGLKQSAHKRYSMFLRWMVLPTFPDFHLYHKISENTLLFPLDTHIIRMAKILQLTERKTADRKMAMEITTSLTEILDEPSVRYDFALSRIGILEKCRGSFNENICPQCELRAICSIFLGHNHKD